MILSVLYFNDACSRPNLKDFVGFEVLMELVLKSFISGI
jgi:hypothetical protein